MEKRNNGKRCSVLLESYTLKAVKPAHDKYLFAAISYTANVLTIKIMDFDHVPNPGIMSP